MSGVGFTCLVIFMFMSLLVTDEFKRVLRPDIVILFSDYVSGITFVVMTGALGILLLKPRKDRSDAADTVDADMPSA